MTCPPSKVPPQLVQPLPAVARRYDAGVVSIVSIEVMRLVTVRAQHNWDQDVFSIDRVKGELFRANF